MLKKALAILTVIAVLLLTYDDIEGFLRPRPDFEIFADPKSITINSWEGSSNRTVITVKSINGFSGNLTFEVAQSLRVLSDVRFTFDPANVTLSADEEVQCVLTLYVCSHIPPEEYYIEVIGVAGDFKRSVRITITVLH